MNKFFLIFLLAASLFAGTNVCVPKFHEIGEHATRTEKLIQLGYDSTIAERIASNRPDLFELIVAPQTKVTPEKLIVRPEIKSTFPRDKWFASQVQDRDLVTVYRGIKGSGAHYDPEFYSGGRFLPQAGEVSDNRIFTTDDMSKATRYPETGSVLLRLKIPRFMLYTSEGGPWGLVFFRDMVPNDLEFVTDVAFFKPGEGKDTVPKFIPVDDALKQMPKARNSSP